MPSCSWLKGVMLAALPTIGVSDRLLAEETSQWFEMVQACNIVISDQTFEPLKHLDPAPFSVGKPGLKEYAVFDSSRSLITTARLEKDEWTHCWVREVTENDRSRWKDVETKWNKGFQAAFPKSKYEWVQKPHDPYRPFVGALLCEDRRAVLLTMPYLSANFFFRVEVSKDTTGAGTDHCAKLAG